MSYKPTHFPYIGLGLDAQDIEVPTQGGTVIRAIATGILKIGDIVYWSALNTVAKSNVQANYVTFAGVVVGGLSDYDGAVVNDDSNLVGAVLTTGTVVLVQTTGIARVVADAAIAVATRIGQGATTAGRVDDTVFTAGQMTGIALNAAVNPGDVVYMHIQPR